MLTDGEIVMTTGQRIGFTGTQDGMTKAQRSKVCALLVELDPSEFHHGDCIGADSQAHQIADGLSIPICIHPPDNERKRAFCGGAQEIRAPLPYLVRNREIVAWSDVLIATPKSSKEELRSGTWSTVRRAREAGKPTYIVLPSGELL